MNTLLRNFRLEFKDLVLELLWRQWSSLGIAGQSRVGHSHMLDPEALLLFTATMGRHDPRLFDEVLDWLQINGWLINVMRLKNILRSEQFAGERLIAAIAGSLAKGTDAAKWKLLSTSVKPLTKTEYLMYDSDAHPLPLLGEAEPGFASYGYLRGSIRLRGHSQPFPATNPACLLLQLRALLGVNVRAEIISYLLTHDEAHPSEIAKEAYYFPRSVQSTLVDMNRSGVIQLRTSNREKHYWLIKQEWNQLLKRSDRPVSTWRTWAPFFRSLELLWLRIRDSALDDMDPLLQSSELRELMRTIKPFLERAGAARQLSDPANRLGVSYLPVFIADVKKLLSE